MKFTCEKEQLLNSINIVMKAVSNRTTLPILECILLKTYNDGFKLTGNDLEIAIKTGLIPANVYEEGTIAIEAKIFSDIIRRLNGNEVTLSTAENNSITISCGNSEFKIMGQDSEEFPAIAQIEQSSYFSLKQSVLKNMIIKTIFSISMDENKPVLTGELMEISNDAINLVAVDGYRISFTKSDLTENSENLKVIVPGKTLREISKVLNDSDDLVEIFVTDNHVLFSFNDNILVSRIIEGEFIKYEQTFTSEYRTLLTSDRAELISSLERVSLISRDARKIPVKIQISKNNITLTSQAETGTAHEEIFTEVSGDDLNIAFNPKYLIEALKAIEDDKVCIQFTSPLSPCIIKPIEGDSYKYLVLPLRV